MHLSANNVPQLELSQDLLPHVLWSKSIRTRAQQAGPYHPLYTLQQEALLAIADSLELSSRPLTVRLPVRVGKSRLGVTVVEACDERALIVTSRRINVAHWRSEFRDWSSINDLGSIADLKNGNDPKVLVLTYNGWLKLIQEKSTALNDRKVLILDEVHKALSERRVREIKKIAKDALVLGIGATNAYDREKNASRLIGPEVYGRSFKDAVQEGVVHAPRFIIADTGIDMSEIKVRNGEFDLNEIARKLTDENIGSKIIETIESQATGNGGVLVVVSRRWQAEAISILAKERGIKAEAVSRTEPVQKTAVRKSLEDTLKEFENGEIDWLICADLLTEAWNSPRCEGVAIVRPIGSAVLLEQAALRCTTKHASFPHKDPWILQFWYPDEGRHKQLLLHQVIGKSAITLPADNSTPRLHHGDNSTRSDKTSAPMKPLAPIHFDILSLPAEWDRLNLMQENRVISPTTIANRLLKHRLTKPARIRLSEGLHSALEPFQVSSEAATRAVKCFLQLTNEDFDKPPITPEIEGMVGLEKKVLTEAWEYLATHLLTFFNDDGKLIQKEQIKNVILSSGVKSSRLARKIMRYAIESAPLMRGDDSMLTRGLQESIDLLKSEYNSEELYEKVERAVELHCGIPPALLWFGATKRPSLSRFIRKGWADIASLREATSSASMEPSRSRVLQANSFVNRLEDYLVSLGERALERGYVLFEHPQSPDTVLVNTLLHPELVSVHPFLPAVVRGARLSEVHESRTVNDRRPVSFHSQRDLRKALAIKYDPDDFKIHRKSGHLFERTVVEKIAEDETVDDSKMSWFASDSHLERALGIKTIWEDDVLKTCAVASKKVASFTVKALPKRTLTELKQLTTIHPDAIVLSDPMRWITEDQWQAIAAEVQKLHSLLPLSKKELAIKLNPVSADEVTVALGCDVNSLPSPPFSFKLREDVKKLQQQFNGIPRRVSYLAIFLVTHYLDNVQLLSARAAISAGISPSSYRSLNRKTLVSRKISDWGFTLSSGQG